MANSMDNLPQVVSQQEWFGERLKLLEREKELTKLRDQINTERRQLPMVLMSKDYQFEGENGPVRLLDMFEGREQLVMHHFMFYPEKDTGCASCAQTADQIPTSLRTLHIRNTTLVAVSRAPFAKIESYKSRMGWRFPWYSSFGSDFNYDFHTTLDNRVAPVQLFFRSEKEMAEGKGTPWTKGPWEPHMNGTEMPGISIFLRVGDDVYYTYGTYGKGIDFSGFGYQYLDLTALGRQEAWEEPKGRATPLGLQAGRMRKQPDEF